MPEWLGATDGPLSPATGEMASGAEPSALLSDDSGNQLLIGTDGGLWYGFRPTITPSPVSLDMIAQIGTTQVKTVNVSLDNSGTGYTVAVASDLPLVTVSPASGTPPFDVTVTFDATAAAEGTVTGTLTLTGDFLTPTTVPVEARATSDAPSAGGQPIALCQTGAGIGENFLTVGGEWVTTPIDGFFGSLEPKGDGAFTITFPAGDYQSTEELGVVGVWGVDPADHLDWADASVVTNMPYYFTDSEVTMTGGPLLQTGAAEPIGWGYLLVWSGWISENYVLDSYGHQGLFTHAGYTWGVDSPWNLCGTDYFAALTGTPPAQEPGWFYTIAYGFCLVDYTVPVPFVIDVTRAGQARTNIPAAREFTEQEQYDRDLQRLVMEGWTEVLLGKRWPKQESFDAMVELGKVKPRVMDAYLESKFPYLRVSRGGAS